MKNKRSNVNINNIIYIFILALMASFLIATINVVSALPTINWDPAYSGNYQVSNRESSYDIRWIVIHTAEGSYQGTISWFKNPSSAVSAHYVISKTGEITQMVQDKDIAYQAGNWVYNTQSIGIEHEGFVSDPSTTEAMYQSSSELVKYLAQKYNIPLNHVIGMAPTNPADGSGIIGHNQVPGATHTDPGNNWNWEYYIQLITGKFPIAGDMNGDGIDTYGLFESTSATFTIDGKSVNFGTSSDLPIIGDWDNDGKDEIGIFRPNDNGMSKLYLITRDWNTLGSNAGSADYTIPLGGLYPNNKPISGNWDGIGGDDYGGFSPNTFYLYTINLASSTATRYKDVPFGMNGDKPLSGDWDNDGKADIGIFRPLYPNQNTNSFFLDKGLTGDQHELGPYEYGNTGDIPVIGDWNGDGVDNIGVFRQSTNEFFTNPNIPPISPLIVTVSETPDPVVSGATSLVTVHVTSGSVAVNGASVTVSANGGSLSPLSGTTDANGDFKPTYTAPTVTTQTLYSISATATKAGYTSGTGTDQITVNPPIPVLSVTVSETPDPVVSGATSLVTVHVTSGSVAVNGASVTVSANGGSLSPLSGTTDANGDFKPTYTAPTVTTQTLYSISATATKAGYTSGTGTDQITVNPPIPVLSVTVSETPDPVVSGATSLVTVHVTSGSVAVNGASVTVSANGGSLSPLSGTTDANGDFKPTYTAPTVTTQTLYSISATATKAGYTSGTGTDQITVNPPIPVLSVTVSETPDPVVSGATSLVTVHVTSGSVAVNGASVTVSANGGSLSPLSGTTDANGDFKPTYTAPTVTTQTLYSISATATKAGYTSGTGTDQITVNPPIPVLSVTVSETPDPVVSGATSLVTVHVTSGSVAVNGASVTVSANGGSLSPLSGTTDANGDFKPTYTAPTVTTQTLYSISATATKAGYTSGTGTDQITVNPPIPVLSVTVSETPDPIFSGATSLVTVHVTTQEIIAVSGASVIVSATGGSLSPVKWNH